MTTYRVEETPAVRAQVERLHLADKFQYEQITTLLHERPHPVQGFTRIQPVTLYGQTFLTYLSDIFPYVIHYRIYEPESGRKGIVLIFRLVSTRR